MAGSFYQVRCPECENEQIIFDRAASPVSCKECGHALARPTGGKAALDAEVVAVVEAR